MLLYVVKYGRRNVAGTDKTIPNPSAAVKIVCRNVHKNFSRNNFLYCYNIIFILYCYYYYYFNESSVEQRWWYFWIEEELPYLVKLYFKSFNIVSFIVVNTGSQKYWNAFKHFLRMMLHETSWNWYIKIYKILGTRKKFIVLINFNIR